MKNRGFTLAELLVSLAVFGLVSAGIVYTITNGSVLFQKNVSVNVSESQARKVVAIIQREILEAVSVPSLITVSPFTTSGAISATSGNFGWGIEFDRIREGVDPLAPLVTGNRVTARVVVFPRVGFPASEGVCELRFYRDITSNSFEVLSDQLNYINPTQMEDYPFYRYPVTANSGTLEDTWKRDLTMFNLKVLSQGSQKMLTRYSGNLQYPPGTFQNQNTFFQLRTVFGFRNSAYER